MLDRLESLKSLDSRRKNGEPLPHEIRPDLSGEIADFFLGRIPAEEVPTLISYIEVHHRDGVISELRRKSRARSRRDK